MRSFKSPVLLVLFFGILEATLPRSFAEMSPFEAMPKDIRVQTIYPYLDEPALFRLMDSSKRLRREIIDYLYEKKLRENLTQFSRMIYGSHRIEKHTELKNPFGVSNRYLKSWRLSGVTSTVVKRFALSTRSAFSLASFSTRLGHETPMQGQVRAAGLPWSIELFVPSNFKGIAQDLRGIFHIAFEGWVCYLKDADAYEGSRGSAPFSWLRTDTDWFLQTRDRGQVELLWHPERLTEFRLWSTWSLDQQGELKRESCLPLKYFTPVFCNGVNNEMRITSGGLISSEPQPPRLKDQDNKAFGLQNRQRYKEDLVLRNSYIFKSLLPVADQIQFNRFKRPSLKYDSWVVTPSNRFLWDRTLGKTDPVLGWALASARFPELEKHVITPASRAKLKALASIYCSKKTEKILEEFSKSQEKLDAGAWHVAVTNEVGLRKNSLIFNLNYGSRWPYPIVRYRYSYFNPKTLQPAADLAQAQVKLNGPFFPDLFYRLRPKGTDSVVGVFMEVTYRTYTKASLGYSHLDEKRVANNRSAHVYLKYDLSLDANGNVLNGNWYQLNHPEWFILPSQTGCELEDGSPEKPDLDLLETAFDRG